uniref:Uncharacterized protein n=1 Tax=Picea sitchensis TaxID=3332 RepID=C0PRF4_PICSI|nr:unknown [Picea sitchensis]
MWQAAAHGLGCYEPPLEALPGELSLLISSDPFLHVELL